MGMSEEYTEAYKRLGSYTAAAREFGVNESVVRRSVQRVAAKLGVEPFVLRSMDHIGLDTVPNGGWVKSTKPDEDGNLYSWYVRPKTEEQKKTKEEIESALNEAFSRIPAVHLPPPPKIASNDLLGFIPLNDLHAGLYAWSAETGYGDWDLGLATDRLQEWVGSLVARMPACEECVLFYNGDTLHANGNEPFTPASKHILDTDSRQFKVVDAVAETVIATTDLAAQKHKRVRLVIKRGNHDEDAYLALLMAAKWRYREQKNVIVEQDPSPFWKFPWGKVILFGHHGDRKKPVDLIMKMISDNRAEFGQSKYAFLWTGHKHQRELQVFHGVQWEQASCLTEPDAYGANWGAHAEAQAVVYHKEKGEHERYSVRP